jgi:SulP family sulfate permease
MMLVLGLTVFVDLITAVATGVVLAALAFVKQMADEQLKTFASVLTAKDAHPDERAILKEHAGRINLFDFGGPLSFGAAADVGHHVRERVKANTARAIVLDFSRVPFVDVSAARAVETIASDARHAGKKVFISGMRDEVSQVLSGLEADESLSDDAYFDTRLEALQAAAAYVDEADKTPSEAASPAAA